MEYINRIELQGIVGAVKEIPVGDTKVMRFSVCTEYAYRDKSGTSIIDCTWHSVVAYPPAGESWDWLTKPAKVWVLGRLRTRRYVRPDGSEAYSNEIVAKNVKPLISEV